MDTPVSAFAVYSTNKKPKKQKNKKKKQKNAKSPKALTNNLDNITLINKAKKLKLTLKKSKDTKKKLLKKKKALGALINGISENKMNNSPNKRNTSISESEEIPNLIHAPNQINNFEEKSDEDTVCSDNCNFEFTPVQTDSAEEGLKAFGWMIAPYNPEEFLNQVWEKKPLHISRNKRNYYKEIISTPIIDQMLRKDNIQFTKNIDITSYVNEKRETHNPEGRAHPYLVWDYYVNGCSIRLLNPQTYIPKLHLLNATLQEFFNSFVGANAYLTPPDSQGFAPHYDDIEAFILQAEGKKHWRIYKPRNDEETLPRVSSKNFNQNEIGDPILEVTLEAGDLLYFPRGFIHQGVTIEGEHSLHVTVSMYQKHSWADLLEKLVPAALQMAINENIELRRGLPFDIYDNFGLVNSDINTPRRKEIEDIIRTLFDKIKKHLPIDEAVDQMNKNYQHDALPPVLTDLEKSVTVYSDNDVVMKDGKIDNRIEIGLDTKIRLLRKNILRMVSEDRIRIYYYVDNSLEYHGNELPYLEIEEDLAPAIENLIVSYPQYVAVEDLDVPNDSDKMQVVDALWSRGLIMAEFPLEIVED
ncbi:bifunctional lysine-specific demethylase and histidyl-hydroxylase NO66 [Galleria mellonella]|uniref:Bifunctional lysine-specific demethylase and histidyl-hydroxylase n=1 Tax=Galleria mellonella TaxID=7137 RepID=A0A6J1W7R8_GALME|nr:bifunctional lysine-specific demethylase and histidyl-hydroxylase NO66 [Galleria mellonella]